MCPFDFIIMMNEIRIDGGVKDTEVVESETPRFANLTRDAGFKIVFGTEGKSEKLLMALLNTVLGLKIVSLQYLPTERLGLSQEESKSFFDVYCKDSNGRRFLIEMQMWSQHYFHKRAVYYSSLSVQDQARVEKKYQKEELGRSYWNYYFAPVYVVSFLNFPNTIVESKEDSGNPYISHYVYKSKDTGKELGDETNIVFIDLEKFRKAFDECEDQRERWLYSIRNMHRMTMWPEGIEGTELEVLYQESLYTAWPPEVREIYERNAMNRNDYGNILLERYEDGMAVGMEKGMEKGVDKGIEIAVKKMAESGLDAGRIAEIMQISIEKVDQLLSAAED